MTVSTKTDWNSRVVFISAVNGATVLGRFADYTSQMALITAISDLQSGTDKYVNIQATMKTASTLLASDGVQRDCKQVVLLYASAYNQGGFTDPTAEQMKAGDVWKLGELASPGFNLSNTDSVQITTSIPIALWQVNCFCRHNWDQFSDAHRKLGAHMYGVCLRYVGILTTWFAANVIGCSKLDEARLVTNYLKHLKATFIKKCRF
ncbi:hypothetical protein L596_019162 [Steinernema carpocapsae]|nr:hypothetical protein L596_019162 [Steinernema carpocapsae]